jgi:proteasome alpha subunit
MKPYEVEILVAQVGDTPAENEIFHVLFDGSVTDKQGFVGIGGSSEELTEHLRDEYQPDWDLPTGVRAAVKALAAVGDRQIPPEDVEAAVLDRSRTRRKFRRFDDEDVAAILADGEPATAPVEESESSPDGAGPAQDGAGPSGS